MPARPGCGAHTVRDRVALLLCNQLQGKFINLVSQLGWICIHSGQSWIRHEIPEVQRLVNSCAALQHCEWHSWGMTKIYLNQSWLLLQTQAIITPSTHESASEQIAVLLFPFCAVFQAVLPPCHPSLRATVTNNPPAGKSCSCLPGGWNTYTQGSQPEKGVLKKHLNNHKPQRSFILFCSFPLLEELFLLPLQWWLQAHPEPHLPRDAKVRSPQGTGQTSPCASTELVTIWRAESGACWGLKTNLVSFLASPLIQERQCELVATITGPLGQGQGCAPLSSKPFQAEQTLKHTKKWQPKAGNAG